MLQIYDFYENNLKEIYTKTKILQRDIFYDENLPYFCGSRMF